MPDVHEVSSLKRGSNRNDYLVTQVFFLFFSPWLVCGPVLGTILHLFIVHGDVLL